ncbi:MAG: Rrf2 family transcriptional regulator [Candidatus Zixiibacteriota bacterium]|nr:MAG: Rrf2 family transcriptional regulator [candidate division Zixibacteria bacterium]
MVLTRAGDYGIFGVLYLAKQPKGKIVSLSEVSRAEGIPEKFLAKIFQSLTRVGLILSHRGARGGFSLSRPADQITVKELMEAIQGPICFSKCLSELEDCEKKDVCKLREVLQKAQDHTVKLLSQKTLADLAR